MPKTSAERQKTITKPKAAPKPKAAVSAPVHEVEDDRGFDEYVDRISARFSKIDASKPIFRTDASGLFDLYLSRLPMGSRQYHTCNNCRMFFERFGGLVEIEADGSTTPVMWSFDDQIPAYYLDAITAVRTAVSAAKVTGVFFGPHEMGRNATYGNRVTNTNNQRWTHYAVVPHASRLTPAFHTTYQREAEANEAFNTVRAAVADYTVEVFDKAIELLEVGGLQRAEHFLEPARWAREAKKLAKNANRLRLHVATAPKGFTHIKGGMVGVLLDHVAAGDSADTIKRSFSGKVDPLNYQRPKAAPNAGQISQAEKLFEGMGLAPALNRRFTRLSDFVVKVWEPPVSKSKASGGLFSDLLPKEGAAKVADPTTGQTMTWVKFVRDVVPSMKSLHLIAPSVGHYYAFTTAVDPEAPPLLRWDNPERRNPVAWYTYRGTPAAQWGLHPLHEYEVKALIPLPSHWHGDMPGEAPRFFALIAGCHDSASAQVGLFPECMRGELHGVRAVIEAYSRRNRLSPIEDPIAGILAWGNAYVAEFNSGTKTRITIDRYE